MKSLLDLTGTSVLSVNDQKAIKGGKKYLDGCHPFSDDCPPGRCCDSRAFRCVIAPGNCI